MFNIFFSKDLGSYPSSFFVIIFASLDSPVNIILTPYAIPAAAPIATLVPRVPYPEAIMEVAAIVSSIEPLIIIADENLLLNSYTLLYFSQIL